jgi:hypothetical protein
MDTGTENVKVAYAIADVIDGIRQQVKVADLVSIMWPNEQMSVRSQIAYPWTEGPPGQHSAIPLFGYEVDEALKKEEIGEEDIIRHTKPMLFEGQMEKERTRGATIEAMMDRLGLNSSLGDLTSCLREVGDGRTKAHRDVAFAVDHYGLLLRWVLRQALHHISDNHQRLLNWPAFTCDADYDAFLNDDPNILIGLPVPAKCTVEDNVQITAAAKRAGIRKPILLSEPAAALVHDLTRQMEERTFVQGENYLVLDVGAGSADFALFQATEMAGEVPFIQLSDEALAITKWCGGAEVNRHAAEVLIKEMEQAIAGKPFKWILDSVRAVRQSRFRRQMVDCNDPIRRSRLQFLYQGMRSTGMTRNRLLSGLREKFETVKKRPSNNNERILPIEGLPGVHGTVLCGGDPQSRLNYIKITSATMKKILDPSTETIITTTIEALDTVAERMRQKGLDRLPIHHFIIYGGASSNTYMQRKLIKGVNQWVETHCPGTKIPIRFVMNSKGRDGLMEVALGGLLLLNNNYWTTRRTIRRECFVPNGLENGQFTSLVTRKIMLKYPKEKELVHFLTHDKRVPGSEEFTHAGNLCLLMNDEDDEDDDTPVSNGWREKIIVYFGKSSSKPIDRIKKKGAKVTDDELKEFEKVVLSVRLAKDDVFAMDDSTKKEFRPGGRQWRHVQYVLRIRFDGTKAHFRVEIPRSGILGPNNDVGPDPLKRIYAERHWEGAFYPMGTVFPYPREEDQGDSTGSGS